MRAEAVRGFVVEDMAPVGSGSYGYARVTPLRPLREDQMDSAGMSDERAPRSVAERSASDRRGRRPHGGTVRPGTAHARQGGVTPLASVSRTTGEADRVATVAEEADQRQAEYFLRLLNQNRRVVEHRIEGYRKAIAGAEASGNTEGAATLRRMARIEEQEREALSALIDKLHLRFPAPSATEAAAGPRRPRLVVR